MDNLDYKKDWLSEIYFQAASNTIEIRNEYYSYDIYDLLGDVGGYLGLFLGWSLLEISLKISNIFCN